MKNREQQILSELKVLAESLKSQLDRVEALMHELENVVEPQVSDTELIDIDIDILDGTDVSMTISEEQPASESREMIMEETVKMFEEPMREVSVPVEEAPAASEVKEKKALIDVMEKTQAWRTDMPGTAVKDLMSAISLNDRVLFINKLFGESHMAFQQARARINAMQTLDEAVDYICDEFPHWDMDSPIVYRFMMAVRRKVR